MFTYMRHVVTKLVETNNKMSPSLGPLEELHLNTVPNVTVSQIISYFSTSYTQSYLPYLTARNLKYV